MFPRSLDFPVFLLAHLETEETFNPGVLRYVMLIMEVGSISIKLSEYRVLCVHAIEQVPWRETSFYLKLQGAMRSILLR